MMNSPAEIAKNYVPIGKGKATNKISRMFALAFMAGMFIALTGAASSTASCTLTGSVAKVVSGCVFPAGLTMVILAGSELFTGNCLIIISVLEKQVAVKDMLKNWCIVYLGNLVGSLLIAWLVVNGHQLSLFDSQLAVSTMATAVSKVTMPFADAFFKGILCNILVCLAVWIAFASKTAAGKIAGVFYPIMLFIICGFEHSIANMFYIGAGLFAKAEYAVLPEGMTVAADLSQLTWGSFFTGNLLPVTLGNIVGGAIFVGAIYWFIYLKKEN